MEEKIFVKKKKENVPGTNVSGTVVPNKKKKNPQNYTKRPQGPPNLNMGNNINNHMNNHINNTMNHPIHHPVDNASPAAPDNSNQQKQTNQDTNQPN